VGAGLVVAAAVVATALWPPPRRSRGLEREPVLRVRAGPLTIALALLVPVAIVAVIVASAGHRDRTARNALPSLGTPPATTAANEARERGGADGAAALAAGIAVGLLGVAAVVVAGRRGRRPGAPDGVRAAVAAGADDALAALAMPADPRTAVLVAYSRMQAALAGAGLGQRASEAPREYLGRISARLGIARQPTERLTGLFERARFSTHAVDESMRRDAVDALERIAEELRGGRA
jgi:hypothetical protein